ncbi:hypothetical protein ACHAWT_005731 [Skeletonema menzelii]
MHGLENNPSENEQSGAAAGDLFNDWVYRLERNAIVSSEGAKREYFLTAGDLATMFYWPVGGGPGNGPPMKCYYHNSLVNKSLNKHGRYEVIRKLEARYKREEKKRMKEEEEEQARNRLNIFNPTADADRAAEAAAAAVIKASAGDTQEVKNLRRALLKMAKKKLGFDMSGNAKNWSFEVHGISKATFAALMGRSTDVDLDSFAKYGAYYKEHHYEENYEASKLFGTPETQLYKDFEREEVFRTCQLRGTGRCTQEIGSFVTVLYKPSTKELSIEGCAECFYW